MSACYQGQNADLIIHNAKIYSCDHEFNIYEAMAIKDGKILQLGPEREILNGYDCDHIIDAQMRPVYPGFHDAHCHFYAYAQTLYEVDLRACKSWDEVVQRVQNFKPKVEREWITGRGWDQTLWENQDFPDNKKLNDLYPSTPVLLTRIDGHAAIANQKAFEISGIDVNTQIEGGLVEVKDNQLTGILLDNAIDSISKFVPSLESNKMLPYLKEGENNLFAQGLTSIHDAGVDEHIRSLFIDLYAENELKIKNYLMLFPTDSNIVFASKNKHFYKNNLTIRSFKIIADGAMGSRGACLINPYSDDIHNHGFMLRSYDELSVIIDFASEIGYQVNTHAIGDSANRVMLNLYKAYIQKTPDHRWRIEHAQLIDSSDFEIFKMVNIIPSVQPTHCTSDMRWAEKRLGSQRVKFAYAYKTLLNQTGKVALGTDFPIENISALETFYAAITRQDKSGKPENGFYKNEALTRKEALLGMTIWAAYSAFQDHKQGSLENGKDADFVILTKDIMEIPESEILNTYVYMTYLQGEQVYSAE